MALAHPVPNRLEPPGVLGELFRRWFWLPVGAGSNRDGLSWRASFNSASRQYAVWK
jgi:hypothetical protein